VSVCVAMNIYYHLVWVVEMCSDVALVTEAAQVPARIMR
jgi:hypothetical protein